MQTFASKPNESVELIEIESSQPPVDDRLLPIRIMFWAVAAVCGIAQAWAGRHGVISDGISYIEIAQAYIRHDWFNAVNAYWSPLFSWLIAVASVVLRPTLYWQVAIVHVVLLLAFLSSLVFFEYFLNRLSAVVYTAKGYSSDGSAPVSKRTLYIGSYSALLFGGLALVGVGHCSPDMIAFALTFAIGGLILDISRRPHVSVLYVALGASCALFYLDRTAFAPSVAFVLLVIAVLVWKQGRPLLKPIALFLGTFIILSAPFIAAISIKSHRLTIGESGRLNYGWEVDGADRLIHWQGKPFDLGKPVHPTTQVFTSPQVFTFATPVSGTYPPWYDPSYWYEGITPKLKLSTLAPIVLINITVAINYLLRSPIFSPACLVILFCGVRRWWSGFFELWPILVPTLFGLALYCFVYFEKRYIAGNFVVLWIAVLAGIRLPNFRRRGAIQVALAGCALLFVSVFVLLKQTGSLRITLGDLIHRHESVANVDYLIAQRLLQLGLHPGDKIAYIGTGINANWARIAGVKIVTEIPLTYGRSRHLLNNLLIENVEQIKTFWESSAATKQEIYGIFRSAGAKMVVTDGFFCYRMAADWPRVLPLNRTDLPEFYPDSYTQVNTRYLPLNQ